MTSLSRCLLTDVKSEDYRFDDTLSDEAYNVSNLDRTLKSQTAMQPMLLTLSRPACQLCEVGLRTLPILCP